MKPSRESIASTYDRAAATYDDLDRNNEARFDVVERSLRRVISGHQRVLEIGCGTGRLLAGASARLRVGVDISLQMLRHSRSPEPFRCQADAHVLPFAAGSFDAVVAGNASFRYLEPALAFAECARVLAPGGRLGVHQYAARTRTLRNPLARPDSPMHLRSIDDLTGPARAFFDVDSVELFRSIRVWPHALRIPSWLPGKLWSQCCVVFRRR